MAGKYCVKMELFDKSDMLLQKIELEDPFYSKYAVFIYMHTCNNFAFPLLHLLYLFALSFVFDWFIVCIFLLFCICLIHIWHLFALFYVFVCFIFVFVCFIFLCLSALFFVHICLFFFCFCLLQIIRLRERHSVCSGPAGKFWPLVLVLC